MTERKILFRGFHPDENGKTTITLPQVSEEEIAEKEKKLTNALNDFNLAYAARLNNELEALKAKRNVKVKGNWVYGDLINCGIKGGKYIHPQGNGFEVSKTDLTKLLIVHKVIPETVGQYTGLQDKNGKRVFEGDICRVVYLDKRCDSNGKHYEAENVIIEEVVFKQGTFCFKTTIEDIALYRPIGFEIYEKQKIKCFEVIGNIHDNPELLREDEE